ncbi:MAG: protein kinase [Eubacteriales bacterium]|nr:protein kinase [Eubacteriales bacterium]
MNIGPYECETALQTAGSGSARWCVAHKDGECFFLKQFLSPVRPAGTQMTPLQQGQLARCDAFEKRKLALYSALGCTLGDCVVPVSDFFVFEGHYFAASPYLCPPFETLETMPRQTHEQLHGLLFTLAGCLARLHAQGLVHADLKPEHVLIICAEDKRCLRLIDFDSGFLQNDPPTQARDMEGDAAYLAPETYLQMSGKPQKLTYKIDTFAFGIMACRLLAGIRPAGDYTYAYEAALNGQRPDLPGEIPSADRRLILETLNPAPEDRPTDAQLLRMLEPRETPPPPTLPHNGLLERLKPEAFGWAGTGNGVQEE